MAVFLTPKAESICSKNWDKKATFAPKCYKMVFENISDFTNLFIDPRRGQGQRHKLHDIIVIILMAILSGQQSIKGFARFAQSNKEDLVTHLGLKHGVPSFNTFRYIMEAISEDIFAKNFLTYMQTQYGSMADDYISMDGKCIKSSVQGGNTSAQNFISVVSAFGHDSKMAYGMKSFENKKSGEVAVVQSLITDLKITDKTITLDALHCKKKTLALILGLSCHFLVQIKGNCRRLWTTMALYCAFHRPISTFEYYEEKHGNLVFRNVTLYALPNEPLLKDWEGISRVAKVRRWGYKKGKPFEETAYYALSRPINSAQIAADAIRGHWSIENDLHWTKDVIMGEDDMSYKSKNAMTVIAYLNNILLNIARAAGEKPNKDFFAKYANKVDRMMNLFYYKKTKK